MTSTTFFIIFIPILSILLLTINLILAPHNPYQEKDSVFECGFHSFLGQNRTQFSVSFFIFGLLFLLFDLEILLVYPYSVSGYTNDIYGLIIMLMFFVLLTLGFIFELGKNALSIDSRQTSLSNNEDTPRPHAYYNSPLHSGYSTRSKAKIAKEKDEGKDKESEGEGVAGPSNTEKTDEPTNIKGTNSPKELEDPNFGSWPEPDSYSDSEAREKFTEFHNNNFGKLSHIIDKKNKGIATEEEMEWEQNHFSRIMNLDSFKESKAEYDEFRKNNIDKLHDILRKEEKGIATKEELAWEKANFSKIVSHEGFTGMKRETPYHSEDEYDNDDSSDNGSNNNDSLNVHPVMFLSMFRLILPILQIGCFLLTLGFYFIISLNLNLNLFIPYLNINILDLANIILILQSINLLRKIYNTKNKINTLIKEENYKDLVIIMCITIITILLIMMA